jgi:hypothetical protein
MLVDQCFNRGACRRASDLDEREQTVQSPERHDKVSRISGHFEGSPGGKLVKQEFLNESINLAQKKAKNIPHILTLSKPASR